MEREKNGQESPQGLDQVRNLPKIDLHRHLLGSIRPATLWALARKYDLEPGRKPLDAFTNAVVHRVPARDLAHYIAPWKLFRQVIQEPADIRRIALEAATDARLDGVRYVEFRNSPPGMPITDGNAPQAHIPADEYFDAIREAFSEAAGVTCRLIASVPRHVVGSADAALMEKYTRSFFDIVARFRDDLIVGVDLTGVERGWPTRLFEDFFAEAQHKGVSITIHAGETEQPEEVWAAIETLGATRIGHGTSVPDDAGLIREVIRRKVVLEVCPTSSWLTGSVTNRHRHPVINCVPQLPYIICTDNPSLNASPQSNELLRAARIAGVETEPFFQAQFRLASQAAFAPIASESSVGFSG